MDINPESRERILNAAHQLFEQSGRKDLPTVDAVRRVSKTSMNDASAVMREWRRLQIVSASAAVPTLSSSPSNAACRLLDLPSRSYRFQAISVGAGLAPPSSR